MKRIRRGVEGCTQPLDWSHGIYHKGAGEEDKTRGGMRSANEKGPATNAGHSENAAVTLMRELHCMDAAAKALQWTILTAARASETLGATRSEIKSPSEFARLAKLPNHLLMVKSGLCRRTNEGGKEHHIPLPPGTLALIAGCNGKLFPVMNVKCWTCLASFDWLNRSWFSVELRDWRPNTISARADARWRWLIRWATRSSKPIGAARASTRGAK